MKSIIQKVRSELKRGADAKTRESFQRFFKEEVKFYGVRAGLVSKISKESFGEIKDLSKKEIFSLCEELFWSGISEEAWIAADWAERIKSRFAPGDFKIFESWIGKYIDNWAKCDTLCNHAVGSFILTYPGFLKNLLAFTKSKNRWMRRAAAVTLIIPAKQGKFLKEIFQIADKLLLDSDDMAQKGYGWMLKEASRKNEKEVFDYVMKNKKIMPRTALRYAIEKMPENLKKRAMEK
ncbi:MAG: DNA alkylation repair protein [Patescibacteria group bacterium]|jgi:3-methyladenine DNA glycosylase AlkD